MLDWLTLKTDISNLDAMTRERLQASQSRILCLDAEGVVTWEKPSRTSIRSDSHQITMQMGSELQICGSPARLETGRFDNVFGSGCPRECAERMIQFVAGFHEVKLPGIEQWQCTRIDVTHNYDLGEFTNVKTALEMLRNVEGGRYQVQTSAESVYWSPRSTRRSGKAYAKGQHMKYLSKKQPDILAPAEMEAVQKLLRLELTLKRHYFKRVLQKPWYLLTENDLNQEHESFFSQLVGSVEISEMTDIKQKCIEAAIRLGMTEGQGRAASLAWHQIRNVGYMAWKEDTPRATFYRHKKILHGAGLSYADFSARNVVPIRRRRIEIGQPVLGWKQLLKVA